MNQRLKTSAMTSTAHDQDFHAWSQEQAELLRAGRFPELDLLDDNPSLRANLDEQITKAYRLARLLAVEETNLEEATFPVTCPYNRARIAAEDFFPSAP